MENFFISEPYAETYHNLVLFHWTHSQLEQCVSSTEGKHWSIDVLLVICFRNGKNFSYVCSIIKLRYLSLSKWLLLPNLTFWETFKKKLCKDQLIVFFQILTFLNGAYWEYQSTIWEPLLQFFYAMEWAN